MPETKDGRVLFLLPWEGSTIAGTTDSSAVITALPRPHEKEIQFIIKEVLVLSVCMCVCNVCIYVCVCVLMCDVCDVCMCDV